MFFPRVILRSLFLTFWFILAVMEYRVWILTCLISSVTSSMTLCQEQLWLVEPVKGGGELRRVGVAMITEEEGPSSKGGNETGVTPLSREGAGPVLSYLS